MRVTLRWILNRCLMEAVDRFGSGLCFVISGIELRLFSGIVFTEFTSGMFFRFKIFMEKHLKLKCLM